MYDRNICTNRDITRLFHMQPIGIGTPYVESLTSYVKRLAEAHSVSLGNLLGKEIIPSINRSYIRTSHFFGRYARHNLNSLSSDINKEIVRILEEKTRNEGLIYLTMHPWENYLNPLHMFRKNQAWCPMCYQESLQLGQPIYQQLIWSFKDIEICKKHNVRLMNKCPHCGRLLNALSRISRIGYCDYCKAWLGLNEYKSSQITQCDEEWFNWVFENVGQLLTVAPILKDMDNSFFNNIRKIYDSDRSQREFEREINLSYRRIYKWISGIKPRLIDVLRLSFRFEYSLIELLTKDINITFNQISKKPIVPKKKNRRPIDFDKLKKDVNEAIDLNKGLSINQLIIITGVSRETLKKYFPIEMNKLKEDFNKYLEECKLTKLILIKETMRSLYQKGVFPSRKAISRELGKRTVANDIERNVWLETLQELGCTFEECNNGGRK